MYKQIRSPANQGIALLLIDIIFFSLNDPLQVSPQLLIVAVGLVGLSMYWLLSRATKVLHNSLGVGHGRKPVVGLTLLMAGLLAMQSVSQLSIRDIAIALPLAAVAYFYTSYNRSVQQE